MRALVPALKEQPVLISGRGDVLGVARHYGFQRCGIKYKYPDLS